VGSDVIAVQDSGTKEAVFDLLAHGFNGRQKDSADEASWC